MDKRGGAAESRAVEKMRIDEEGRGRRAEARMMSKMKRDEINEKFDKELNDLTEKLNVDKRGNPIVKKEGTSAGEGAKQEL